MDSKEAVVSNQSGFPSSVVSSDDKIETVDETNASKSVANSSNSSSNPVSGLNPVSDDDNEGFASGEEEAFETNLVVSGGETLANVDEGDSFLETSEFPVSKVESDTVSDGVVLGGGVDDAEKGENSSEIRVEANGVKVTTTEGDSVVEKVEEVEIPAPGVVVVDKKEEDEDEDEDEDDDEDEGVVLVGGPDDSKSVVKPPELETNGGNEEVEEGEDAVVEGIDVELPVAGVAGVAVVGKKEGEDGVDSSEKMEKVLEEVVDKEVVDVTGGGFSSLDVEDAEKDGKDADDVEVEKGVDYEGKENGSVVKNALDDVETVPTTVDSAPVTEVSDKTVLDEAAPVAESLDKTVPDEAAPVAESLDIGVPDDVAPKTESLDKDLADDVAQEVLEKDLPDNGAQKTEILDKDLPNDVAQKTEVLDKDLADDGAQKTEVLEKDLPDDGAQKAEVLEKDLADDVAQKTEVLGKDLANDVAQKTEVLGKDLANDVAQKTEVLGKDLPDDVAQNAEVLDKDLADDGAQKTEVLDKELPDMGAVSGGVEDNGLENGPADKFVLEDSAEKDEADEGGYTDGSDEEEDTDGVIFGSSEAAKQFMEELERGSGDVGGGSNAGGGESSQDRHQMMDGQIVTDSDEDDDEEDGKELFDSAALAALLKAAADGGSEGGNITFSSQDGSRLFTVERPAGLGPSLQNMRAAPRPNRANIFNPASLMTAGETDSNLSDEDRKKLETLQSIRVKFLRLVQRLGLSPDESVAAQVLYRLALIAGRQTGQSFSLDAAKRKATELEAEGNDDLNFSVNILVIGKAGVGKSATINSIFGEEKTLISAFQPATSSVKEIRGMVGGVMIRVFDTPGLRTSVMDQGFNRQVLASAKKFTKRNPPDIVLYVDRLDAQTRDHNDIPLLKTITTALGPAIWRSAIVTFTHGASAPPEGSNGIPLSYEMFVTQRSHVVQQAIGHAVGDLRMMSPSLMNPVSLVENHQSCRKNRDGQKVLPNGQTWRPQLLMLCYSMKILAEANALSKPQDPYDNRKLFGFRVRSPPLPYMLSSMLQSRAHPKLTAEQGGGDGGDSDVDLADLSESDEEDEDEYDQLPPFKPLRKTQLAKLSREQRKAYFDEYDYRVKLLQKKQWKDEVKRMKEMKKRGGIEPPFPEEDGEGDAPAPVAVPLPDMALPPSFDGDNPAYRFRFLEPTSQFLARPVLDTHGWDHDCGYDGVNVEQSLAIASRFPAAVSVQVTKDKKDFSINMDSSVSVKHGEKGSSMAGFDVQPIGKQLAYIVRGETKFKNLKKNKTAAGMSVTFLGENVVTGFKVEDQIAFGKQYSVIGSAGTVRFQTDSAYGANIEIQRRELDYPIGQVQSTVGVSIIKWRGDLALGFNGLAQFAAGRNSKVAVRAGINNKMSGQVTVKTSSSEHLSLALAAVLPSVISAYKKFWSSYGEKNSAY